MDRLYPSEEEQHIPAPTDEEMIDRAADLILDLYREAFEELAK